MFTLLEGAEGYHKWGQEFVYKTPADFMFGKILQADGKKRPVDHVGRYHLVEEIFPTDLEEVYEWLQKVSIDPHKVAIRFQYKNTVKTIAESCVEGSDEKPSFNRRASEVKDIPSNILCLDIDSLPLGGLEFHDLEQQGLKVLELLAEIMPEVFSIDNGFIAKASSSSGFSNLVKMHMFIKSNRPIDIAMMKSLFYQVNDKHADLVDLAMYSVVQPHYFSNPQFATGVVDPYDGKPRIVMREGTVVQLPDYIKPYRRNIVVNQKQSLIDNLSGTSIIPEIVTLQLEVLQSWHATDQGFRTKVLSLYHRALQNSFDLGLLDNLARPIIRSKRPGQEEEYIKQGRLAAFNAFVSRSARVLDENSDSVSLTPLSAGAHEHYLKLDNPPPANSITFLKASLGTGKTWSMEQFIKEGKITGKFLTITNNSALVEANAARFGAGDFRNPKTRLDFVTGKISALSGTIHSLWRLENVAKEFDFVFIDESDSVMNDLLYAPIIADDKKFVIKNVLSDLLRYTNRVVISDGDLSQESIQAYARLAEYTRPLYKIEHYRNTLKGAYAYQHKSQNSLWGALHAHLDLGEKVLLVSDLSPDGLNSRKMALGWSLPHKKIHTIHSNSKEDKATKHILQETNNALGELKVDALLCSPSITSGVDFSYFDAVFVLTISANQPPNLRYQALRRDRQAKCIHYYFKNFKGYRTGFTREASFDMGWTETSQQELAIRRERECEFYINTFQYYLLNEGCQIEVVDDPYDDFEVDKDAYMAERIGAIMRAAPGVIITEHNDAYEVRQNICLYNNIDEEELTDDIVYDFVVARPDLKAAFIHTIYDSFWDHIEKGTLKDAFKDRKLGHQFFLATGREVRTSDAYIKQVLAFCGIKDLEADKEKVLNWYLIYLTANDLNIPSRLLNNEETANDIKSFA